MAGLLRGRVRSGCSQCSLRAWASTVGRLGEPAGPWEAHSPGPSPRRPIVSGCAARAGNDRGQGDKRQECGAAAALRGWTAPCAFDPRNCAQPSADLRPLFPSFLLPPHGLEIPVADNRLSRKTRRRYPTSPSLRGACHRIDKFFLGGHSRLGRWRCSPRGSGIRPRPPRVKWLRPDRWKGGSPRRACSGWGRPLPESGPGASPERAVRPCP